MPEKLMVKNLEARIGDQLPKFIFSSELSTSAVIGPIKTGEKDRCSILIWLLLYKIVLLLIDIVDANDAVLSGVDV